MAFRAILVTGTYIPRMRLWMLEKISRYLSSLILRAAYFASPPPRRQTCKACWRCDKLDFHVTDETWNAVVPKRLRTRVVCLPCFDDFAREARIPYAREVKILYFAGDRASLEFRPVSAVDLQD